MKKTFLWLFLLGYLMIPCFVSASIADSTKLPKTIFQYLQCSDTIVPTLTITTDLRKIYEDKFNENYLYGELEYQRGEGQAKESWEIKVTPRGKSRKKICTMPPLRLKFSKKDLRRKELAQYNKIKLVTFCKNKDKFEQYVRREYLVYKLYNIITDNSFRVQRLKVVYKDVEDRYPIIEREGFILENTDEMAHRLNARDIKKFECKRDSMLQEHYDLLALFQFMVGNTDWRLDLLHNVKTIKGRVDGNYIPVAYDFDYSGIVNSSYAIPNPDYYQLDIRHRVYMGELREYNALQPAIDHFLQKRAALYAYCKTANYLQEKERKSILKYLEKFYKIIESPKRFKRQIRRQKK